MFLSCAVCSVSLTLQSISVSSHLRHLQEKVDTPGIRFSFLLFVWLLCLIYLVCSVVLECSSASIHFHFAIYSYCIFKIYKLTSIDNSMYNEVFFIQKNKGLKQCNTYWNAHNPPDANSSRSARLPLLSGDSSNKQGIHINRNKKGQCASAWETSYKRLQFCQLKWLNDPNK